VSNTIQVTCQGAAEIALSQLSEFQGEIKTISETALDQLKARIIKHGINAPVFVWVSGSKRKRNYVLDGHQRMKALRALEEEGWQVPAVPVAYIHAKSRKDAVDKLLAITSQYGQFDIDVLYDFTESVGIDLSQLDIRLVDGEIPLLPPDFVVDEDRVREYQEPEKQQRKCPHCGHVDSSDRFRMV
jgi:hypothetical protein